jgi:hypothetical protein
MPTPLNPTFAEVESAYREFYWRLAHYLDDAGAAVDEDFACRLDQDLDDLWRRFEERCRPCGECDCFPCRCDEP